MQIQHDFGINTPEGLALSVDMWKLPPGSSTALLRDDDNLKVAQSTEPSLQVGLARLVPAHAHAGLVRQILWVGAHPALGLP